MPFFISHPPVLVAYTIVPWVGVMLLGYAIGPWFSYPQQTRDKLLLRSGALALIIFVVLRFLNISGDPSPWSIQQRAVFTPSFHFLRYQNLHSHFYSWV